MGDFLVMEYVEGTDLGEVMKRTGSLSISEAIAAVRQAALALGYAHQRGIVHRDIKPANLLRDVSGLREGGRTGTGSRDGVERDQGIGTDAVGWCGGDGRLHVAGAGREPAGSRCTKRHLQSGLHSVCPADRRPGVNKSSLVGRLLAHRVVPPPMLSAVRSDAPATLDAIFQRMLAQSPDDRFASMEKVVAALDALNRPQVAAETMQLFSKAVEQAWAPDRATVLVVEESRCRPA